MEKWEKDALQTVKKAIKRIDDHADQGLDNIKYIDMDNEIAADIAGAQFSFVSIGALADAVIKILDAVMERPDSAKEFIEKADRLNSALNELDEAGE